MKKPVEPQKFNYTTKRVTSDKLIDLVKLIGSFIKEDHNKSEVKTILTKSRVTIGNRYASINFAVPNQNYKEEYQKYTQELEKYNNLVKKQNEDKLNKLKESNKDFLASLGL